MKANPDNNLPGRRRATGRPIVIAAAILAVAHACLVIEGRGIVGFILWVLILFVAYWLLFTFVLWLWRRYKDRT